MVNGLTMRRRRDCSHGILETKFSIFNLIVILELVEREIIFL